ncbi:hypothetical protein TNCV_2687811 [Trichonephila clavipes]|nr:hypothetical protein TNCV_2687811 [Trichonephila clavipes]
MQAYRSKLRTGQRYASCLGRRRPSTTQGLVRIMMTWRHQNERPQQTRLKTLSIEVQNLVNEIEIYRSVLDILKKMRLSITTASSK